jgi:hypothetical protein
MVDIPQFLESIDMGRFGDKFFTLPGAYGYQNVPAVALCAQIAHKRVGNGDSWYSVDCFDHRGFSSVFGLLINIDGAMVELLIK